MHFLKPLGFYDYGSYKLNPRLYFRIVEPSARRLDLNFPALNIRESLERPEGMEEGAVMMVGLDIERVIQGLNILIRRNEGSRGL